MLAGLKKNRDTRQEMQQRTAATALAVASAFVLAGALIMLIAYTSGALKLTGSYTTTQLKPGSFSNSIECDGSVEPIRVTDVTTKAKGAITAVYVHDGEYVKQGKVLFDIKDGDEPTQSITATVSGTVSEIKAEPGMTSDQIAATGTLMRISDMNMLVGVIKVPEYLSVLLEDGLYVNMTSTATPGIDYQGILTGVSNTETDDLDSSGQAQSEATVMFNNSGTLRVGDPLKAQLFIEDYGEVYYVPASAVKEVDGVAYLYIVRKGNTIEQRQVELLGTSDSGEKIIKGDSLTGEIIIRADLSE